MKTVYVIEIYNSNHDLVKNFGIAYGDLEKAKKYAESLQYSFIGGWTTEVRELIIFTTKGE